MIALLANGNVLVEGLPGLAKTRAVKSLSANLESDFSRIQFTPDLLPSDVTGGEIYRSAGPEAGTFEFHKGPIFANLVLADEINRAPAKVQSALLEAMEERQVTVAGKRYTLPDLFMVLATQNPIEQEGTYPLPEAQTDRFLMHVLIGYPTPPNEQKVLQLVRSEQSSGAKPAAPPKISQSAVFGARAEIDRITTAEAIETYIVALTAATRAPKDYGDKLGKWIAIGASPRGSAMSASGFKGSDRDGHLPHQLVDHVVGLHALGRRVVAQRQAMTQAVVQHALHVLGRHEIATLKPGAGS